MPLLWLAGGALIGDIGGALIGSSGANSAAQTQANAANQATQAELAMFGQTQANLAPYMAAGTNALPALQAALGLGPGGGGIGTGPINAPFTTAQFQNSPGYQFQLQQGVQAAENAASATGGALGGNTLQALTQYGTGLANQDYWNAYNAYVNRQNQQFNQLNSLVGGGQNAAAGLGGFAANTGQSIGNNIIGAGNAISAGQVAGSNAIGNSLGSIGNNFLLYNALSGGNLLGGGSTDLSFLNLPQVNPSQIPISFPLGS